MSLEWDRDRLKRVFDEDAELYDRIRPGYPDSLFDDLIELSGIPERGSLLEIGCGTGQATRSLADRGYRIVCVELGEALAEIARRNFAEHPNVKIVNSSFESWESGDSFELVLAATSWHWVDPEIRCKKAASVLRPKGCLAIITTHHHMPEEADPFFAEIQDAYGAIGEGTPVWPPPPDDLEDLGKELESSGLFEVTEVRRFEWEQTYTADEYIDLVSTYSNHRVLEQAKRDFLFGEMRKRINARPSGTVTKNYMNALYIAHLLRQ